jgi:hypothetical protein
MKKAAIILLFFLLPITAMPQEGDGWRGIVPLVSSKAEVRSILGKPESDGHSIDFFVLPDFKVIVEYSTGRCPGNGARSNVRKGIVVNILVLPMKIVKFEDLKLDASFVRGAVEDDLSVDYTNDTRGISCLVDQFGEVSGVSYRPTRKLRKAAQCK